MPYLNSSKAPLEHRSGAYRIFLRPVGSTSTKHIKCITFIFGVKLHVRLLIRQIDRSLLLSAMSIVAVMMDVTKIAISGECDDHHHQHRD